MPHNATVHQETMAGRDSSQPLDRKAQWRHCTSKAGFPGFLPLDPAQRSACPLDASAIGKCPVQFREVESLSRVPHGERGLHGCSGVEWVGPAPWTHTPNRRRGGRGDEARQPSWRPPSTQRHAESVCKTLERSAKVLTLGEPQMRQPSEETGPRNKLASAGYSNLQKSKETYILTWTHATKPPQTATQTHTYTHTHG